MRNGFAFLCPNGTLFNQEVFVCDWYQHVDCASSENFYGKNLELNMNINNMSDMMAMVNQMMTFPLKPNATPPMILPTGSSTQPATPRFIPTTKLPFAQTTKNANKFPSTLSTPTFNNRNTGSNLPTGTKASTKKPNGLGERAITQEGDFEINSKNESDRLNKDDQTILTNQPIFISSLGELSTDVGNKFDINKSNIIKPDQNEPITPPPVSNQTNEQLEKSLADSFRNRQNGGNTATPSASDNNLLRGLQQVLQQNPDAILGEDDLIEFIRQILERNPDLTADQLNAILSAESDAILKIVNDTLKRNQNTLAKKAGKNQLLDSIQNILNKYKSNTNSNQTSNNEQEAVFSGEADLLSTIQSLVEQSQIPIFTGEADLLQFIELIKEQNPDFTEQQLNAIISDSGDSIIRFLKETKQKNNKIGSADLSEAIRREVQKYRKNGSQPPKKLPHQVQGGSLLQNQPTATIGTNKNGFNTPTLQKQQPQQPIQNQQQLTSATPPQFVSQPNKDRDSSNLNFINSNANQNPNEGNVNKPVSNFGSQAIESGEADLIQTIQQIVMRLPNQRVPIFRGEADLLEFIQLIKQQNPDLNSQQLAAIISGEASSILQVLNEKAAKNEVNGFPVISGEADLLEAIQIAVNKYRQNNQASPPLPDPIFSGEMELLESVQRIQQRISVPILSGEADLLQFIRRIEQQNPDLTPYQLNQIISGEMDSILSIFNEKREQSAGLDVVESGEADLLDAIQIVINRSKGQLSGQTSPVTSGSSDILSQVVQDISQKSSIPIFSGEADLVQFIERLLQQNPGFSKEQLSAIINDEENNILGLLNQKARSNAVAVESGEAILLEAIQIVLEKYKDFSPVQLPVQSGTDQTNLLQTLRQIKQQSSVPLFTAESDILQFSQRLQQRNPNVSPSQLNSIISNELPSILKYVKDKQEKDQFSNFAVYSGEEDLLVAVQYYVEQYAKPDTGEIVPPPKSIPVQSGASGLSQTLQKIQQQTTIPIFSGEADLVQFIELIKQRNPDFTSDQLTAIISGEADSILQILNGKIQKNQSNGIAVISGASDLLEAIQLVTQKYRSKSVPSPSLSRITQPQQQQQTVAVQSGESDLLQTLQRIRQKTSIPIFSGEADLVQFIELVKQRHPELTTGQLNTILSGEANLISQILNEKAQRNQYTGTAAISGESDLLEALEIVIQKYQGRDVPESVAPQTVTAPVQSVQYQSTPLPQLVAVQSGESDLLQTIQSIEGQSTVPIFSGEADLVQFIEIIKQGSPEFSPNQLNTIISGEANSILQILNEKQVASGVSSTNTDLLDAITQILNKYKSRLTLSTEYGPPGHIPSNLYQTPQTVPKPNSSRTTVNGQLTAVTSGQSNAFYKYSNQIPGDVSANGQPTYSVEQNKQSQFSNQQKQTTQSQITKNVYRGQDNIYTKTAISHQTRSQSTSTNSEKFHYKITPTIPYQQTVPVQTTVASTQTPSPNAYIPPYPSQPSYSYPSTEAPRQVFTYPSENQAHRQSASINIATDSIKYQQAYNKQIVQQTPASNAYVFTEIENRPPVNPNTLPHPPLQTVYPESIQNNVESRVVKRPAPIRQYTAPPIPSSLPSIVHEPSNTVSTIQNVPNAYNSYAQSYSSPVITSTYSNREIYSQANSAAREKVVVKVVKAPGWYLNDPNERRSYFDAVAHGSLGENGLVYVNNVQKENKQLAQNTPINGGSIPAPVYLPKNTAAAPPQSQSQSQTAFTSGTVQSFNGINYCPCANAAYSQSRQVFQPQYQTQYPIQQRQHSLKKRSAQEGDLYSGRSSYDVPFQSVGRLAGDNLKYQYNLASLRQPFHSQPQLQQQIQRQQQQESYSQPSYRTQYRQ